MTSDKSGQPLRFLALLMIAWVAIRIAAQYGPSPLGPLPLVRGHPATAAIVPRPSNPALPTMTAYTPPSRTSTLPNAPAPLMDMSAKVIRKARGIATIPMSPNSAPAAARAFVSNSDATTEARYAHPSPIPILASASPKQVDRWRGSSWILWRGDGSPQAELARTGRLGSSQIGARLDYVLNPGAAHRVTTYTRASSALESPTAPEAAIGLAVQPVTSLPVSVAIERRIAIGAGARNAMAVTVVGGFGPTRIAQGVEAEAYAQTGIVGFRQRDAFIDGKLSLLARVQNTGLRLGAAISGGAQPGVSRLDIAPEMQVRLPLDPVAARLSVEWRERIAGRAAPSSGFALTLGADF